MNGQSEIMKRQEAKKGSKVKITSAPLFNFPAHIETEKKNHCVVILDADQRAYKIGDKVTVNFTDLILEKDETA